MNVRGFIESLNPWTRLQLGVFINAAEAEAVERHIRLWRRLHATQIAIICDPFDESFADELDRLDIPGRRRIYHLETDRDILRSAAAWKGWQEELTHFVMAFGDESIPVLHAMLDHVALDPETVCLSTSVAVFPRSAFTELARFEGDLHDFLRARSTDRIASFAEGSFPALHEDEFPSSQRFSLDEGGSACPA